MQVNCKALPVLWPTIAASRCHYNRCVTINTLFHLNPQYQALSVSLQYNARLMVKSVQADVDTV